MRTRLFWMLGIVLCCGGVVAFAGPFDWREKPVIIMTSDMKCSKEQPCKLVKEGWLDGSATFRLIPVTSGWPEDKLPSKGTITVNGVEFKMSQRKENGKIILFGSVPVGTFDLDSSLLYTLLAYDSHDVKLADDLVQR